MTSIRTGKASFSSSMWVMTTIFWKSFLDGVDGLNQPLKAGCVLAAETFVYEQRGKGSAGAVGQQPGQGDAQGEVDAERLSAAVVLVATGAEFVGYLDVQGLYGVAVSRATLPLGLQLEAHPVVADAAQDVVGLVLKLRDGLLYEKRLYTPLAKGRRQLVVHTPLE